MAIVEFAYARAESLAHRALILARTPAEKATALDALAAALFPDDVVAEQKPDSALAVLRQLALLGAPGLHADTRWSGLDSLYVIARAGAPRRFDGFPEASRLNELLSAVASRPHDELPLEAFLRFMGTLPDKPAVPEDAKGYMARALETVAASSDAGAFLAATRHFESAAFLAPWWPDAYWNAAVAFNAAVDTSGVSRNVRRFLLAQPGEDARRRAAVLLQEVQTRARERDELERRNAAARLTARMQGDWRALICTVSAEDFNTGCDEAEFAGRNWSPTLMTSFVIENDGKVVLDASVSLAQCAGVVTGRADPDSVRWEQRRVDGGTVPVWVKTLKWGFVVSCDRPTSSAEYVYGRRYHYVWFNK